MSYTMEKKMPYPGDLKDFPEETARAYATETEEINGHTVYFIPFDHNFGYSCVVYRAGRILPYAGDYALHHRDMYRSALRDLYIQSLSRKLVTDDEYDKPLKDYEDYIRKREYLHNQYGYQRPSVSIFRTPVVRGSEKDLEGQREFDNQTKEMVYDPIAFAYYAQEDHEFVIHHCRLYNALHKRLDEKKNDYDFYFGAFKYEMANHEYPINWQGNYDVCSAFGNVEYDHEGDDSNLTFYFDQLNFTDAQRRAYRDAARYVYNHSDY